MSPSKLGKNMVLFDDVANRIKKAILQLIPVFLGCLGGSVVRSLP